LNLMILILVLERLQLGGVGDGQCLQHGLLLQHDAVKVVVGSTKEKSLGSITSNKLPLH
jgi:hypothetical protein